LFVVVEVGQELDFTAPWLFDSPITTKQFSWGDTDETGPAAASSTFFITKLSIYINYMKFRGYTVFV
jgi:hypothetical protein